MAEKVKLVLFMTFYELVKDGIITLQQAADKMDKTITEFDLAVKDLTLE